HHCLPKAARLAGFPRGAIRLLPSDEDFRLPVATLAAAIAEDRRAGRRPFLVVASAGTVNTGAVDPLPELADLAQREGLWLHVDGAYGGCFALTARGRLRLAGIERADSVVLDPHKGLFLPYGTGALLVRDGAALRRTHAHDADYLPRLQEGLERVDFCEISPELSRPFRGLRVWLPFALHGAVAFRAALDEKLDLATWIAGELVRRPEIELVAAPELSLLAFRPRLSGRSAEAQDAAGQRLLAAANRRQRVHLTGTRVRGRFVLRICVLSFRTHRDRMEQCLEDLDAALAELAAEPPPGG
ncbi:MAG: pyridoxal phosphate-dependent decarboxylase family protein, partial [Thermoanaerobaculia bacterium]